MPPHKPAIEQPIKSAQGVAQLGKLPYPHQPSQQSGTTQTALSHTTVRRALANSRALAPNEILQLQRSAGNQAVQRMLRQDSQAGIKSAGIRADGSLRNPTTAQRTGLQATYVSQERAP